MKKWLGIILAVMICSAALLAGCEKQAASSGSGLKICFSLNAADTFRDALVAAAEKAAKEQGAQLDVMDAQGVIETQAAQIKQAVADGYDVIICSPVSAETAVELEASAGELPMIFVNSCPKEEYLTAGRYMYAGSEDGMAGQYQAEYILDQLADRKEINIVLLKGPSGHSATAGRTKGLKRALAASGKTVNYVFEDYADWDTDKAEQMLDIFLRTGTAADCVICNNDSMALGAIAACKKAGTGYDRTLILGVDATAAGCEAIENGEMDCTIYQSATGQGQAAVAAAVQLAAGRSVKDIEGASEDEKYIWVPFEKVDSSNVSKYK